MLLFMAAPTMAQALSAEQQQKLAAVASGLSRVKTNAQLALESAGPGSGVPQGSRAKLSKMRLDTAAADLPQLRQWLAELPADAPEVQPVAAELASVEESIAALDARLAGAGVPPAPEPEARAPTPAAAPAAPPTTNAPVVALPTADTAPTTVKLGYQQEEVLKGARFNLREVEGSAAALTQLVAELQPQTDQMSIDHRKVRSGMNSIEAVRRKAGFAQDALDQLPANGQGVAEATAALAEANGQIDAAAAYLGPLDQALTKLIDPASYPELQADLRRLNELTVMYGNPVILQTDRPQAAAVLTEAGAASEEVARIARLYLPLIEQQTEEGKRIEAAGNYFLEKQRAFLAAAEQEKQTLPQQIRADLAEADGIAAAAVAEQKPLFFTGGIPQLMGFVADKLALYAVLDPAGAPALDKETRDMQASLQQREKSLGALIIQQNPLPQDRYRGADRDQVVAVAVDAWKHQQADFSVLADRIPSEAWSRETMWSYSNGSWYYVDRSRLQVQLIVADEDDDSLAIIRPVNVWMDHQKGDSLIGTPLHAGNEALQPSNYMQRDKIRQAGR
jgi:hypothetical protein